MYPKPRPTTTRSTKNPFTKRVSGKTAKHRPNRRSQIVHTFIEMLNVVKLYHWKTHSYAEHKATDQLYERLGEKIDRFVEVYLGKDEKRIQSWESKFERKQPMNKTDFKRRIYEYREFLKDMSHTFDAKKDSDLLSIRDDILGDINQFLYLMTFNK
jgi:hypothetical protein